MAASSENLSSETTTSHVNSPDDHTPSKESWKFPHRELLTGLFKSIKSARQALAGLFSASNESEDGVPQRITNWMEEVKSRRCVIPEGWPAAFEQRSQRANIPVYRIFRQANELAILYEQKQLYALAERIHELQIEEIHLSKAKEQGSDTDDLKATQFVKEWASERRRTVQLELNQHKKQLSQTNRDYYDLLLKSAAVMGLPRASPCAWLSNVTSLPREILEDPSNDFLFDLEDNVSLEDSDKFIEYIMWDDCFLADCLRVIFRSKKFTRDDNDMDIYIDRQRIERLVHVNVVIGCGIVLVLPAALILTYRPLVTTVIGPVSVLGCIIVFVASLRGQPIERLFMLFCTYMAVLTAICVGLQDTSFSA